MDMETLVRLVTQKVLEQMQHAPVSAASCVMVLGKRDEALVARLSQELEPGTAMVFLDEQASATPVRYILPYLCCGGMADLALGRVSSSLANQVLQLLLSGQKIEVLELEYTKYRDTAPAALYSLYESYEETLRSYGLVRFVSCKKQSCTLRETLVTEAHVEQAHKTGACTIVVPARALVTPAAVDAAKDLHICIDKRL